METTTFTLTTGDGIAMFVYKWMPDDQPPKAIVQILHGVAEYAGRYARLADALTAAGYVVYANDLRGHGKTAQDPDKLGLIGEAGWEEFIKDVKQVTEFINQENYGIPLFLLGHSMGAFLAQSYIQRWGARLKGVILSGTTGKQPLISLAIFLAKRKLKKQGADALDIPLNNLTLGSLNKSFKPAKTAFDWLSRDEEEVQKYVNDPYCGFNKSNGLLAAMLIGEASNWKKAGERKIPKNLPIYLCSGSKCPVGLMSKGVVALYNRYKKYGITDVTMKLYEGARHEVFNETNRDEVTQDLIEWVNKHL